MQLIKKLMAIGLILFLSGCATPRQQVQVKRTAGDFEYKTRVYKNYDHNLQLVIPKYWTVYSGDALYRLPIVIEAENTGWETLIFGESENQKKIFVLMASPWYGAVEEYVKKAIYANDPLVDMTTKKMRIGEIDIIERNGYLRNSGMYVKQRFFVYKLFGFAFVVSGSSPVSERDAEILENLSFQLEDKESSPLEKKLQLPEKPQTSIPITQPPGPNIVTVTGTSANIRSGAGNDFSILTTVKKGDRLILIGEHGEWLNVWLENGQEGWINNKFVK